MDNHVRYVDAKALDLEKQRRDMDKLLSAYRSKIAKLEETVKKRSDVTASTSPKQVEEALQTVASLKDNFRAALNEADARTSALERARADLAAQLEEAQAKLRAQGGSQASSIGGASAVDVVPAANVERHIEGLSKATSALANENIALGSSLTNASGLEEDDENAVRAMELAAMHQKLLQLHVGFIMHAGQATKLQDHSEALAAMSDRDMELAWFWFRGAISALGGALRGRTNITPQPAPSHEENEDEESDEDRGANIAWGDEDYEEEGAWSEEEVDDEVAQPVESLEPFKGHIPHWKRPDRLFPELESFDTIAARAEDYCGPSDESNWVIPGLLLVGAFPGVTDDDENWDLITSILSLGITTFVCLQDEYSDDAPEEDWRQERNGAIRPYFRDVREIVKQVEDAPEDFPNIHITSSDLHFVHFPIIDCDIAEDHSVYNLAVDLVERCARGEVIYLHCWGGHGRTGSVVCIMEHLMYGLSATEAMQRCQFVHDLRRVPMEVQSPQKPSQRNQVRRIVGALEEIDHELRNLESS